ncbi:hypothetical protein ACQ3I4_05255 [Zafaria sp. Z1313]|uniref:hypothetical protein n=1 Tax=Zafaria sp. Z1313 TaxID=3423202 RepID=UPI003D30380A
MPPTAPVPPSAPASAPGRIEVLVDRSAPPSGSPARRVAAGAAAACAVLLAAACTSPTAPAGGTGGAAEDTAWPEPSFSRQPVEAVAGVPAIDHEAFLGGEPLAAGSSIPAGTPQNVPSTLTVARPPLPPGAYTASVACSSPVDGATVSVLALDDAQTPLAVTELECAVAPDVTEEALQFLLAEESGLTVTVDSTQPALDLAVRVDPAG